MPPQLDSGKIKFFGLFLGFLALLGVLLPLATFGATLFEDDFESYNLGDLNGQGDWSGSERFDIQASQVFQGEKAVEVNDVSVDIHRTGNQIESGQIAVWIKMASSSSGYFRLKLKPTGLDPFYSNQFGITCDNAQCDIFTYDFGTSQTIHYLYVPVGQWFLGFLEWNSLIDKLRLKVNNEISSAWVSWAYPFDYATGYFEFATNVGHIWFDYISEGLAPSWRVYGISPVSGTEITSTSTEFSFGWEGLATSSTSYYQGFWLNFREEITGIKTEGYLFTTAQASGTATTSLENFEFDKNSDYYLTAIGAGYTFGYYTDLVSPEFYYTINVAGLGEIFKMTDFSTWYAENSVFATPTAIFISLTGFLEPVFSKVGEFGERITNFFDLDDAYTRGFDIGIIFPTFGQYIDEIEVFMGGFPLIKLFLVSLLVLLGIFIIKLIMKFIPFFGG